MPDFKKNKLMEINGGKTKNTSWNSVANWYDDLLESGQDTYQSNLILPNVLRLLQIKKGEKVLDLGCGQGFFAREFFKSGAEVVGVDLSKNLVDLAEKNSPREIRFEVASADNIGFLGDNFVDVVVCISAIQNMKNVQQVFSECFRTLKSGGRMVIVMNHPSFRIPKRSSWGFDEKYKVQYRRVDEYISESQAEINLSPGSDSTVTTVSFHHPLQFYFKALHKSGFLVSRLEEWTSAKTSQPGPRAGSENKARKEFPLFLALEASKI